MIDIRALRIEDIPQALNLSEQAGWNQLAGDWQRMVHLWPEWCLAGWDCGRLIATATLAVYGGSLGWVGMVLVDREQRGKGVGSAMLNGLIALADQQGVGRLGLDATDAGRPVYLKRGFADIAGIARWTGPAQILPSRLSSAVLCRSVSEEAWRQLLAFDQACAGVDRSSLLRELAAEPGASLAIVRDDRKNPIGMGFARAGRQATFIGPLISASQDAAESLLARLLKEVHESRGAVRVLIDAPVGGRLEFRLQQAGFQVQRRLTRMVRNSRAGDVTPLADVRLAAAAGFELG
jgi:GNAT superfamily N-acetyltransferase